MSNRLYGLSKKGLYLFLTLSLLISIILIQQSSPVVIYDKPPLATAVWEISPVYNNSLGSVIVATLRLTHSQGTTIDYERMPDVGDIWDLRDKPSPVTTLSEDIDPIFPSPHSDIYGEQYEQPVIDEGQVEVRSRSISKYLKGEKIVTEIRLELQYLDPIDFSGLDDKRLSSYVTVFQVYWHYDKIQGLGLYRSTFEFEDGVFYMAQRVSENSVPILKIHHLQAPRSIWSYLRLTGFGFLAFSLLLLIRQGFGIAKNLAWNDKQIQTSLTPEAQTTLGDLYTLWLGSLDYHYFVQAVILFRQMNAICCPESLWEETTYILYGGDVLQKQDVSRLFEEMMKEDLHDTSV